MTEATITTEVATIIRKKLDAIYAQCMGDAAFAQSSIASGAPVTNDIDGEVESLFDQVEEASEAFEETKEGRLIKKIFNDAQAIVDARETNNVAKLDFFKQEIKLTQAELQQSSLPEDCYKHIRQACEIATQPIPHEFTILAKRRREERDDDRDVLY